MRIYFMALTLLTLIGVPAWAQSDAAYQTWDKCIGENTADYAEMFGAISIDEKDVTNALGDCYDEEEAYRTAHPGVPETIIMSHKEDLKNKWIAAYANRRMAGK
ncbi:MAG TPA: hypothetical protein VIN59_03910 [Alphaproteobacteria bacterium]